MSGERAVEHRPAPPAHASRRADAIEHGAPPSAERLPSSGGRRPLAHELEQGADQWAAIARSPLSMSQPGDAQEQEAERAASQVIEGSAPVGLSARAPTSIARACTACEEEAGKGEEKSQVLRSADGGATTIAPAGLTNGLGSGRALDRNVHSFMANRFQRDFSGVRVHEGSAADAAARSVDARAFTVGNDIVFRDGAYRPTTLDGRRLLAHELAHTIQQQGVARCVQRQVDTAPTRHNELEVSQPGDAHEVEADAASDAVVSGGTASVEAHGVTGVHRQATKNDAGRRATPEEKKHLKAARVTAVAAVNQLESVEKSLSAAYDTALQEVDAIKWMFDDMGKTYEKAYANHKNTLTAAKDAAEKQGEYAEIVFSALGAVAMGATVGKVLEAVITCETYGPPVREALQAVVEEGAKKAVKKAVGGKPKPPSPSIVKPVVKELKWTKQIAKLWREVAYEGQSIIHTFLDGGNWDKVPAWMNSYITGGFTKKATPQQLLDKVPKLVEAADAATILKFRVDTARKGIDDLLVQTYRLWRKAKAPHAMEREIWIRWIAQHGIRGENDGPIGKRLRQIGLSDEVFGISHREYEANDWGLSPVDEEGDTQKAAQEFVRYEGLIGKTGLYEAGVVQIEGRGEYRARLVRGTFSPVDQIVSVRVTGVSSVSANAVPESWRPNYMNSWNFRHKVAMLDCEQVAGN